MNYHEFWNLFLVPLKNKFALHLDEKSSNNTKIVLRSTISSEQDAEDFINNFSEVTNTKWIVRRNKSHLQRLVYRKNWICQLSSHRKTTSSSRNFECEAKVYVKVKKVTKYTVKRDRHLSAPLPLCGVIDIHFNHTHPVDSADILMKLRVSDEVEKQFFSYFDDGKGVMVAKRYHENMILMGENYKTDLDNAAKNPTNRQVYHLYCKWRAMNSGPADSSLEMHSCNESPKSKSLKRRAQHDLQEAVNKRKSKHFTEGPATALVTNESASSAAVPPAKNQVVESVGQFCSPSTESRELAADHELNLQEAVNKRKSKHITESPATALVTNESASSAAVPPAKNQVVESVGQSLSPSTESRELAANHELNSDSTSSETSDTSDYCCCSDCEDEIEKTNNNIVITETSSLKGELIKWTRQHRIERNALTDLFKILEKYRILK